jgi:hypothetical protein
MSFYPLSYKERRLKDVIWYCTISHGMSDRWAESVASKEFPHVIADATKFGTIWIREHHWTWGIRSFGLVERGTNRFMIRERLRYFKSEYRKTWAWVKLVAGFLSCNSHTTPCVLTLIYSRSSLRYFRKELRMQSVDILLILYNCESAGDIYNKPIFSCYTVCVCVICIIIYLDEYSGTSSHSILNVPRQPPACRNPRTDSLLLYRRAAGRAPNSEEAANRWANQYP